MGTAGAGTVANCNDLLKKPKFTHVHTSPLWTTSALSCTLTGAAPDTRGLCSRSLRKRLLIALRL